MLVHINHIYFGYNIHFNILKEKELPVASIENLEAIDKLINEISLSNRENLGISIYAEVYIFKSLETLIENNNLQKKERYIDTLFDLYLTLTTNQQFEQIFSIFKGMSKYL